MRLHFLLPTGYTPCKPTKKAKLLTLSQKKFDFRTKSRRRRVWDPQLVAVWNHSERMYGIHQRWYVIKSEDEEIHATA